MSRTIPCPICRSTRFVRDSLGFYVCENGHQALFHRQEEVDDEDRLAGKYLVPGRAVKKDKAGSGKGKTPFFSIPVVLDANESRFLELEILQLGIFYQVPYFVNRFGIRDEPKFRELVLDFWMLYVTLTGLEAAPSQHSAACLIRGDLVDHEESLSQSFSTAVEQSKKKDYANLSEIDQIIAKQSVPSSASNALDLMDAIESDTDSAYNSDRDADDSAGNELNAIVEALESESESEDHGHVGKPSQNGGSDTEDAQRNPTRDRVSVSGIALFDKLNVYRKKKRGFSSQFTSKVRSRLKSVSSFLSSDTVYIIPLLACYWMKIPATPKMVEDSIRDGSLPLRTWYGAAVPLFMRKRFKSGKYARALAALPTAKQIENLVQRFMFVFWHRFEIYFPKLDWVVLLPSWLSDLHLPLSLFPIVHELVRSLSLTFAFRVQKLHYDCYTHFEKPPLSNFAMLAGVLLYVLKLVYGLDGIDKSASSCLALAVDGMPSLSTFITFFTLYLGPDTLIVDDKRTLPYQWANLKSLKETNSISASLAEDQLKVYVEQIQQRFPKPKTPAISAYLKKFSSVEQPCTVQDAKERLEQSADELYSKIGQSESSARSPAAAEPSAAYARYDMEDVTGQYHREYVLVARIISRVTGVHEHDLHWATNRVESAALNLEELAKSKVKSKFGKAKFAALWNRKYDWKWSDIYTRTDTL